MSMVYIHEGTPMEGSEQADVTLYHLSEKRRDFIISIYGFLPLYFSSKIIRELQKILLCGKKVLSGFSFESF